MQKKGRLVHYPPKFLSGDFSLNFCFTSFPARKRKWVKRNTKRVKKILLVEGKRFENKTWEAMGIPLYFFLSHPLPSSLSRSQKKKNAVQDLNFFPGWSCMHASHVFNKIHAGAFSLFRQRMDGVPEFLEPRVLKGVCHLLVPLEYPENIPRVHFREFLEKIF